MGRKHKIRLLHIITRLVRGGADENTIYNIRGLDKCKYQVDLLVGGDSDFDFLKSLNDIQSYVIPELRRNVNPWYDSLAFFKLIKFLKKNNYQIVHTHTAKAGFLGRITAEIVGTPIIVHTLHGTTFHEFINPLLKACYIGLEKVAGHYTDKFITVGEDLKQKYLAKKIGSPTQYTTIYSGFDIDKFCRDSKDIDAFRAEEFKKLGISDSDVIIGTVSRLESRKGHTYLFQAVDRLLKEYPNARLLVVGEGPYRANLEKEVEQLKLEEKIHFLGYRLDIPKIIALFDIFVLTSLWEGLPRVLVQAALLGKPIVTFDVEGAGEVVRDGVNGFIVPPKNVAQLTQKLLFFATDLFRAQQTGLEGKKIVCNNWDIELMVEKTEKVYEDLIENLLHNQ